MFEFEKFAKTKRHESPLNIVVTEKIDGTNAQILLISDVDAALDLDFVEKWCTRVSEDLWMACGSRNKYLLPTKEKDNYGFCRWAWDNHKELVRLGEGRHYGEWYGAGIQRKYALDHKRLALFNTSRWKDDRPSCCDVVPTLYDGDYIGLDHLHTIWEELKTKGSALVTQYNNPEGLMVYFTDFGKALKMPFTK